MEWALVDQNGDGVGSDGAGIAGILARLPRTARTEFHALLGEAYSAGDRRRMSVTRAKQPLMFVDVVPLNTGSEPRALVVVSENTVDGRRDSAERLARRNEAILASSMDGFFIVDADCRFIEVNDAFCRMTGYSSAELRQMRITDLEATEARETIPAHTTTGMHHFPVAHRHKDGRLLRLEVSLNVLHDDDQKILVGFAREISERIRAQEEIARLMRQRQLILDSTAEGIAEIDGKGRFVFLNAAGQRLLGATPGEVMRRTAHGLLHGKDVTEPDCGAADCALCGVLRRGKSIARGMCSVSRKDAAIEVEYTLTPVTVEGAVSGAVLVIEDVSERRRIERERVEMVERRQQAERLESMGLLAGGIAHDLNNTLAGVMGNATMGEAEVTDPAAVRERLRRIVKACERASGMIQQVLAYSGRAMTRPERVALHELIAEVTDFMRAGTPESIELMVERGPAGLTIDADAGQIEQVLSNLISNAIEAIGEAPGRIVVRLDQRELSATEISHEFADTALQPGAYAELSVRDTGCGMPPEVAKRIFEPFYSKKGAGRGLGLAAMYGIIKSLGGAVRVDSAPQRGTRFVILLPLERPAAVAEAPRETNGAVSRQPTVLVIDDEDEVREVIRDILRSRGLNVITAENGTLGVELFRRQRDTVDVVLLDMTMPDKSGGEVMREILADSPAAQIVVVSGYSEELLSSRFETTKPAGFVHKPFTADALVETINDVLAARGV